jgi:putative RNA 2'-phosphotransferase
MDRADIRRSKRLSAVLRHRPESIGIELDEHGWVGVTRLLAALARHGSPMSREDLDRVVRTNDKKRFEWDVASDAIRARQGHSVEVDLGLEPADPPDLLYHGTAGANVESILATGLDRRGRHHVHLSPDLATAHRVGARRGASVVLEVDAAGMAREGLTFWRTTNGVWLTDQVPPRFIARAS